MTEAEIAQRRIETLTETETYERRAALRADLEARGLSAVQRAELHLLEESCAQIDAAHDAQAADECAAESAWERAAEYDAENQAQLARDEQYGDPIPADLSEQWDAAPAQVDVYKMSAGYGAHVGPVFLRWFTHKELRAWAAQNGYTVRKLKTARTATWSSVQRVTHELVQA